MAFSLAKAAALNNSIDSWALAHGIPVLFFCTFIRMQWHLSDDLDTIPMNRRRKQYMGSRKIAVLIDSENTPHSKK
ncbi:TPA: hypothetical protein ACN30M_004597 [Vibrio parahaemolyticus]